MRIERNATTKKNAPVIASDATSRCSDCHAESAIHPAARITDHTSVCEVLIGFISAS